MDKKKFEEFLKEMLPLIEKITEIAGKYNSNNELISVTCSSDGYFHLSNHSATYSATRCSESDTIDISQYNIATDQVE